MNNFDMDDFLQFIKWENSRLCGRDDLSTDCRAQVLTGVTKLMEENGELASEILINLGLVRKEKLHDNKDELAKEFADVALVLWMLADRMDIDMAKAIQDKMEIVRNRKY
jgi:NTP pyrophosphatase (non-canonical NTP hydrolase)